MASVCAMYPEREYATGIAAQARVMNAMTGPVTIKQLRGLTGMSRDALRLYLHRLEKKGKVTAKGRYQCLWTKVEGAVPDEIPQQPPQSLVANLEVLLWNTLRERGPMRAIALCNLCATMGARRDSLRSSLRTIRLKGAVSFDGVKYTAGKTSPDSLSRPRRPGEVAKEKAKEVRVKETPVLMEFKAPEIKGSPPALDWASMLGLEAA